MKTAAINSKTLDLDILWRNTQLSHRKRNVARYDLSKRAMDILLTVPLAVLIGPLLIILSIIIKLESEGPVFFVQRRTGKWGRRFGMLKLRTMVNDAEKLKHEFKHLNKLSYPDFKIEDDPRITRIGKFLRKTSLDELPQLINVIKGDMSLVGPRPTSFPMEHYSLWHTARLEVIPGITGIWQISGRSNIEFDDRSRLDVKYIRNRSIALDVKILMLTLGSVINKDGAF